MAAHSVVLMVDNLDAHWELLMAAQKVRQMDLSMAGCLELLLVAGLVEMMALRMESSRVVHWAVQWAVHSGGLLAHKRAASMAGRLDIQSEQR